MRSCALWLIFLSLALFPINVFANSDSESLYWDEKNHGNNYDDTRLHVGPGITVLEERLGLSMNFSLLKRITSQWPVFVGVDVGVSYWSFQTGFPSTLDSEVSLQLLPTAYYQFHFDKNWVPYLGLSVGPNIFFSQRKNASDRSLQQDTRLLFEFLIRPGVEYKLADSFSIGLEPKFGWLDRSFLFSPHLQAVISF